MHVLTLLLTNCDTEKTAQHFRASILKSGSRIWAHGFLRLESLLNKGFLFPPFLSHPGVSGPQNVRGRCVR